MVVTSLRSVLSTDDFLHAAVSAEPVANVMSARLAQYQVRSIRDYVAAVAIRQRHHELYGNFGLLGAAEGSGLERGESGYTQHYEGGRIDLLDVDPLTPNATSFLGAIVEYVGLRVNEPNEVYDDPYIIFTVVNLNPDERGQDNLERVVKVGPLDDVDEGVLIGDIQTVWRGDVPGTGIVIGVGAYDYDMGDPDEVREAIEAEIREKAREAANTITAAYGSGQAEATAVLGSDAFTWAVCILSLGIVEILDLGDDFIGSKVQEIAPSALRETRLMSDDEYRASLTTTTEGYSYSHKIDLTSRHGDYSVYFRVRGQMTWRDHPNT